MRRALAGCALVGVSLLTGCIVFPHRTHLTPMILGELPDRPEARVRVSVSDARTCQGTTREVTTNEHGRFVLAPLREWNAFVVVMAHKYFHWDLCVYEAGQWRAWHSAQDYTLVDTGPVWTLVLRCSSGSEETPCKEEPYYETLRKPEEQWLEHGLVPAPAAQRGAAADGQQRVAAGVW
jgi:hypothetical protein